MTNLEKLRTGTPEQIADMFCDILCEDFGACSDVCPRSIFERCAEGKNGFEEWLNEEAIAQKDTPKGAPKKDWKKPQEPKDTTEDVSKGWIKLRRTRGDIYIEASRIVGLGPTSPDEYYIMDGAATKVYTRGAEDDPWFVYDSIDEIIEKIKKA